MRSTFSLNLRFDLLAIPVKGYSTRQTPADEVKLNADELELLSPLVQGHERRAAAVLSRWCAIAPT
jgi:hypothetical protein